MAFEQNYQESMAHFESAEDFLIKQKVKSMPISPAVADNINGCFDCNICLDSAHDPVVTLCGHLFCWPCIYKWINVQSSSPESQELPKCPVCKANISSSSLVPLYGRGTNSSVSEAKKLQLDQVIPRRPPALGMNTLLSSTTSMTSHTSQHLHPHPFPPQPQYIPHPFGNYAPMANIGGAAMTNWFSPTVGMFGEMVFARMFGSSDASLFAYPNAYPIRRQEMQVETSLNRVSIFLFCCFVLCLLLF